MNIQGQLEDIQFPFSGDGYEEWAAFTNLSSPHLPGCIEERHKNPSRSNQFTVRNSQIIVRALRNFSAT
jgi:hypothetical protein